MEYSTKLIVKYLLLTNNKEKKLKFVDAQINCYRKKRNQMLMRIKNMRQQQLMLLEVASSNTLKMERRFWHLNRTEFFWENDCQKNDEKFFKENFRMDRKTFNILCEMVAPLEKQDTPFRLAIPLQKRVAIAVYTLGSSSEYRIIANLFAIGKSTVCHILKEFCEVVCTVMKSLYLNHFPLTQNKIQECVDGFKLLGFPQCLGAIDGSHIEIHPNLYDAVDYYNYKGWYSIVLFALVDYRFRFLYVNIGSPGRCNDSTIFEQSSLKKYLEKCSLLDEMSEDICGVLVPVLLVGDSAFRFSKIVQKPYPFHAENNESKKQFNYALSKSRRVVENAFGQLKARFKRVGKGIDNAIDNANSIIMTSCILHNFLNENNDHINQSWLIEFQNNSKLSQPEHEVLADNTEGVAETIRQAICRSIVNSNLNST